MSYIPGVEQAKELVMRYNKDPFHIQHAETVSKVMGELAKEFDPDRVDFWAAVGMLHDIDFELYPEQHCVKANEMLHELDIDEEKITMDSNILEDLEADSLDVVDMVMSLEDEFGVEIPDEEIENLHTVGDVVRYVEDNT